MTSGTLFSHQLNPTRCSQKHAFIPIPGFSEVGTALSKGSGIYDLQPKLDVSESITGQLKKEKGGKNLHKFDLTKEWDSQMAMSCAVFVWCFINVLTAF